MRIFSFISLGLLAAAPVLAQTSDDQRDHAVDQLVGQWSYEACSDGGNCSTVQRVYDEPTDDGLVHYTEQIAGETREGFVGYDTENQGYFEYDYPEEWSSEEFEHSFRSEQAANDLFGTTNIGRTDRRTVAWTMNEEGSSMTLRALGESIEGEGPTEILGVIFSRVPIIGSDPIIGGDN